MQMLQRVRAILRAVFSYASVNGVLSVAIAIAVVPAIVTVTGTFQANAKTPGSTYCFYGKCHRVKTIAETQAVVGKAVSLHTSYYDSCHRDRYNPCGLTSSGEKFHADRADNAASPIYPDGTKLLVWSPQSKDAAVIRVNNAGPYWGNRKLDVSRALAEKLGFTDRGVTKLEVRVLSAPTKSEARYKRNRRYDKVHGPIGKFDDIDAAQKGLAVLLAFDAMATSVMAPSVGSVVAEVERPFEVAALATEGRAFAEVQPELQRWPVVMRRFASITWPVVDDPSTRNQATALRIAEASTGSSVLARQARAGTQSLTWPVVAEPPAAKPGRDLIRVAIAWPTVAGPSLKVSPKRAERRQRRAKAATTKQRKTVRRKLRTASAKKKAKRRASSRTRKAKVRTVKSKRQRNRKPQSKVANVAKKNTKPTLKAVVKRRVRAPKPYIATRHILHRNLGRSAG
ncbi:MAG: hypothetical protein K0U34_08505 [Alphaproteobacteria bacterium]|nr:hypothetical protein [Alphaproteobacteria bacterium]